MAFEPVSIGPLDFCAEIFFNVLQVRVQILLKQDVLVEMASSLAR